MIESKLVKHQMKELIRVHNGKTYVAHVRWDDCCGNRRNSFSITGTVYRTKDIEFAKARRHDDRLIETCGCIHEQLRPVFPELENLFRWHLSFSDGPMHYFANAKFWAGFSPTWPPADNPWEQKFYPANYDHLRSTIVWGALPLDTDVLEDLNWEFLNALLYERLPKLVEQMRKDITDFGFEW